MAANDLIILNKILEQQKAELAPGMTETDYFGIFTTEQILKEYDLSYDEIQSGIIDGGGDGGIDAFFIFLNGELAREDTDYSIYKKDVVLEVQIIQSKTGATYSEEPIHKLIAATDDLLNLSTDLKSFESTYNKQLLKITEIFRNAFAELASKFPKITFNYYYASKGDDVHQNVKRKVENLRTSINNLFSHAAFGFKFIGAKDLLELARKSPIKTYSLNLAEGPITSTGAEGFICLVRLKEYFEFITDSNGKLLRNLFEANVRDYQGNTQVNSGIQTTLKNHRAEEFWWLNNGITIIATKATLSGKKLTIEDPQIVNGLQTSTETYNYFKSSNTEGDQRNILIRIIVPDNPEVWDRIIFATNSQTKIPSASLRATEKIHRDIEEFFKAHDLFYDRRKNFYKNQGKPLEKIISIPSLAQAIMSIVLKEPNNARARPSSLLNNDQDYIKIFNPEYPINLYLVCARVIKKVEFFLKANPNLLEPKDRTNIKHHLVMYLALSLTEEASPTPEQLAKISLEKMDNLLIEKSLPKVKAVFEILGGTDQIAKGPAFKNKCLELLIAGQSS